MIESTFADLRYRALTAQLSSAHLATTSEAHENQRIRRSFNYFRQTKRLQRRLTPHAEQQDCSPSRHRLEGILQDGRQP